MVSGCLVEDPPSYTAPARTPPRLSHQLAKPPIDQIYVTQVGAIVDFSMPVASEDAGVDVTAYLLVDFPGSDDFPIWTGSSVPASTLDDTSRELKFSKQITTQFFGESDYRGCHRVTLRATHRDNWVDIARVAVIDKSDVAEAYWWLNIIEPNSGDDGSVLVNCPTASEGQK